MKNQRPSDTAQVVARGVWLTANEPSIACVVPPSMGEWTARFLAACPSGGEQRVRLMAKQWYRRLQYSLERTMIPGIALHYVLRKRYIEDVVQTKLNGRVGQVVVLGAGFDTLATRLHTEYPTVQFIEVDHPATQNIKRDVLANNGNSGTNLLLLPLDLTKGTLEDLLLGLDQFDATVPTVMVVEGLTMYLTEQEVKAIFHFVRKHCGLESEVIFTFMEQGKNGNAHFPAATFLVDLWLKLKDEQFKWGCSQENIPAFLHQLGFEAIEIADTTLLRSRYLKDISALSTSSAQGELVCRGRKIK